MKVHRDEWGGWSRYTERGRRSFFFGHDIAVSYRSTELETSHILLAMLQETDNVACQVLRHLKIDLAILQRDLEKCMTVGNEDPDGDYDRYRSEETQRAQMHAWEEARQLGANYIATEHLLLGLLRVETCIASQVLRENQATIDAVRSAVRHFLAAT